MHDDAATRSAKEEVQPHSVGIEPIDWMAQKRNVFKETLHHDMPSNSGRSINEVKDSEQSVHVRHAMLWIKVNVIENMSKKHMKWAKRQKPKLWLFQITGHPANMVSTMKSSREPAMLHKTDTANEFHSFDSLAISFLERCETKQSHSQQESELITFGMAEIGHHVNGTSMVRAWR